MRGGSTTRSSALVPCNRPFLVPTWWVSGDAALAGQVELGLSVGPLRADTAPVLTCFMPQRLLCVPRLTHLHLGCNQGLNLTTDVSMLARLTRLHSLGEACTRFVNPSF